MERNEETKEMREQLQLSYCIVQIKVIEVTFPPFREIEENRENKDYVCKIGSVLFENQLLKSSKRQFKIKTCTTVSKERGLFSFPTIFRRTSKCTAYKKLNCREKHKGP